MKKILGLIGASILALVILAGCIKNDDSIELERLRRVQPGLYIYSAAQSQNEAAMQPSDIAIRMAILRAEAVKQDKLDRLDEVVVAGVGNVKTLLFGSTAKISSVGNLIYEISYAGGGGMPGYDSYARMGTVRVNTQGCALEQTDSSTPWSVTLVTDVLTISGGNNVMITSTGNTSLYRKDDKSYAIEFKGVKAYIQKQFISDWSGEFTWSPAKGDDLSFSNLDNTIFGLSGKGGGASLWTLNNSTSVSLSYEVTDGQYSVPEAGYRQIINGKELCKLTNVLDYSIEQYPSPEVLLAWSSKGDRLTYVVAYNGYTLDVVY